MRNQSRFYILTLGCQMNKNDSERIVSLLLACGAKQTNQPGKADLLLINTCSVRQSAEDRAFGAILNWQKLRAKKKNLIIAVTGCMPGRDKDGKIKNKLPGVDLWFPIDALPQLPGWLMGLGVLPLPYEGGEEGVVSDYLQITPQRDNPASVFVSIQTGCNNFCTYCVVPQSRGRERNRPLKDILDEVKKAVARGAKEITLLGQVVNNYKIEGQGDKGTGGQKNPFVILSAAKDPLTYGMRRDSSVTPFPQNDKRGDDFAALLWEINQIPGDFRIHFTAADPQYFTDEQIEALKLPKMVNYLHLPVQSGDNEILKKMNRHYTREDYIKLVKKIKKAKPDIALGTDIIVGFCGETEKQFKNTVDLYKKCDFDISYHAMYSERSGTAAYKAAHSAPSLRRRGEGVVMPFADSVPNAEKKRRWDILQSLMENRTFKKNQKYVGKTVRVLTDKCELSPSAREGVPRRGGGVGAVVSATPPSPSWKEGDSCICSGNSDELKLVQFLGTPKMVGTFQTIKITQAQTWVLKGVLIDK